MKKLILVFAITMQSCITIKCDCKKEVPNEGVKVRIPAPDFPEWDSVPPYRIMPINSTFQPAPYIKTIHE